MNAFDVVEGGRVVAAAPGIVTALGACRCDEANEFLRDALQVVTQLGRSPGEGRQLLHVRDGGLRVRRVGAVRCKFGGVRWHICMWFGG